MKDDDKVVFYRTYSNPGAEDHTYYCLLSELNTYKAVLQKDGRSMALENFKFYEDWSNVDYFGHESDGTRSDAAKGIIEHVYKCHTGNNNGKDTARITELDVIHIESRGDNGEYYIGSINLRLLLEMGFPEYVAAIKASYLR